MIKVRHTKGVRMFKFKSKKEMIGIILGAICFLPSFIIAIMVGAVTNLGVGIWIMMLSQVLWLISITLCTWNLEMENRKLKEKLKQN